MLKNRFFWWAFTLLAIIFIVWLASNNQGYVLIIRSPYRIQISFNFFLVVFVLSVFGLHHCLRFLRFLRHLPAIRRSKKEALRLKAGNTALLEGMHALAAGDFESAEASAKLAQELIQNSDLETLIQKLTAEKNKRQLSDV
ncbi:heme biosynthesis HemY N-terminal domain-containing protein [Methylotenera mobilis]|uniref:HemY domain protein n=1 Tax=Methylotenera mobilis (strain JLW8 / ATCC BAA-1282 / DSM 17540) TaxID=583345 RepID=C6WYU8_METML|nr:heme biosynthesis HemY N-terminal domain-containing protein [Methylotenera mobilis]ACT47073.1 HemY domain protein [Methylotenera mobilis JLW8]